MQNYQWLAMNTSTDRFIYFKLTNSNEYNFMIYSVGNLILRKIQQNDVAKLKNVVELQLNLHLLSNPNDTY